ncbi:TIGR01841 family phasin [Caballeronia insecticola]|uniref:Phasin polyhydroxyalkanoate synthesis and granule formation regulator/factor n=1 Tax=Caballeronia insecticola TaxID=758793 RepID=A0A060PQS6_9BURK|nr:TIGR01841 family phasin [Caballeronia insecticola]BAO94014.1 phasin; polyhydroxyalkanoate synthesis and granule formation regulator/factor [Caballeronia insecticola]
MFPFSPQQVSSLAAANFQSYVSATKRLASGLQQLAELNVQTVKTVFGEGASVLKAGTTANPGDLLSWQSTLFAEIPEKTAAYTRHYLTIVRSTQADILNETRKQYEQNGLDVKGFFESVPQGPIGLLLNVSPALGGVVKESTEVVLDAAKDVDQTLIEASAEVADSAQGAPEAAARSAKAASKRQS